MARTNFSGPINVGRIQNTTGTSINENVRNVAFVECHASFPVNHSNFTVTTDADRLAVTGSNGASTTSVTLVDATLNVPGITSDGGFEAASVITLTSAGDDSARTATITGTDVLDNAQTEDVTMANAGVATSTKTFKTVTGVQTCALPIFVPCLYPPSFPNTVSRPSTIRVCILINLYSKFFIY